MVNDITVFRNDDHDIIVTFTDSKDVEIDISEYVIFFTVKEDPEDADENALIKIDETIGVGEGTTGSMTINITPSDTSSLVPGKYVYDIQWKDTDNKIKTLVKGDFILKADVTTRTTPE